VNQTREKDGEIFAVRVFELSPRKKKIQAREREEKKRVGYALVHLLVGCLGGSFLSEKRNRERETEMNEKLAKCCRACLCSVIRLLEDTKLSIISS